MCPHRQYINNFRSQPSHPLFADIRTARSSSNRPAEFLQTLMHMDTSFAQPQRLVLNEQHSWSSLSPELSWTSLTFNGTIPLPKLELTAEPENSIDGGDTWCNVLDEVAEASKEAFEMTNLQLGYTDRSLTSRPGSSTFEN